MACLFGQRGGGLGSGTKRFCSRSSSFDFNGAPIIYDLSVDRVERLGMHLLLLPLPLPNAGLSVRPFPPFVPKCHFEVAHSISIDFFFIYFSL